MNMFTTLEESRHQLYIKQHQADDHFPLDGSNWARLVAMRLYEKHHPKCICTGCTDFYVRLHTIGSPLGHERESLKRAYHYWFLQTDDHFGVTYTPEPSTQEVAWKMLARLASSPISLAEAEKKWLEGRSKQFSTPVPKKDASKDKYWLRGGESEMWESRPLPKTVLGSTGVAGMHIGTAEHADAESKDDSAVAVIADSPTELVKETESNN